MPTIEELGQKVKAKYPQYNDLSDLEVGQKVKAKYPDAYSDFTSSAPIQVKSPSKLEQTTIGQLPGAIADVGEKAYTGFTNLPGVKQFSQGVGGVVGGAGAVIGGTVGFLGGAAEGAIKGTGVLPTAMKRAGQVGSDTAKFGYDVGKTAAPQAIIGAGGKVVELPLAAIQIASGVSKAEKGNVGGAVADIGMGLLSGRAGVKDKGVLLNESFQNLGVPPTELKKAAMGEEAKNIMYDVIRPSKGEISKFEVKRGKDLRDIAGFLAEEKSMPEIQKGGTMDWTSAIEEQKNKMSTEHSQLDGLLSSADPNIKGDWNTVQQNAYKNLGTMFKNASELKEAKAEVDSLISAEKEYRGESPSLKDFNDSKSGLWQIGYRADKPMQSRVSRVVGHEVKSQIDDLVKGTGVENESKKLNEAMSKRADAISVMGNATGRKVKNNAIVRVMAGFTGALGLHGVPVIGPAVGAAVGEKAAESVLSKSPIYAVKKAASLMEKSKGLKPPVSYLPK